MMVLKFVIIQENYLELTQKLITKKLIQLNFQMNIKMRLKEIKCKNM